MALPRNGNCICKWGKRNIGNHISYYNDGDLIFIGANLHFGFTDRLTENKSEVVIQVREFLG